MSSTSTLLRRTLLGLTFAVTCGSFVTANAQTGDVPDQVYAWRRGRTEVITHTGEITEYSLTSIKLSGDKNQSWSPDEVQRVVFGAVPPSFRDGATLQGRGDFENAVARFRVAAGDASARDVVKAAASLRAAESLLSWGSSDPVHFSEAAEEFESFLSNHPEHREVPTAMAMHARAQLLSGDAAAAAKSYRDLFGKWTEAGLSDGFSNIDCLDAALQGARSLLMTGDSLGARELFGSLDTALNAVIPSLEEGDASAARLKALQAEARMGDGFAELEGGNLSQARTFFEGALNRSADEAPNSAFAARLGLAEAMLREGKVREAQMHFAHVAALDFTDRDRAAQAILRQAECAEQLKDNNAREQMEVLLTTLIENFGDTPWARAAREKLPK